jgi:hypothetical protein
MQTLINVMSHAYTQIVILALLCIYLFTHNERRMFGSGVRIVRMIITLMIFLYFMFIWASTVEPTLRAISIFGMFAINLGILYNLLLARVEHPYRQALKVIAEEPESYEFMHNIWHKGKRYYYVRYLWASLFSGATPFRFLRNTAIDRVRDDIRKELRRYGVQKKLISLPMMVSFVKGRLAADEHLPGDFKDLMSKAIDDFAGHPWIEQQVNDFLQILAVAPEDLHFSEWMAGFEPYAQAY